MSQLWNTTGDPCSWTYRGHRQRKTYWYDHSWLLQSIWPCPPSPAAGKIHHYGIRGSTYNWIRSFLQNRNQQVVVDGATSDKVEVISGVPQVTFLGPLLFLMFINDLPDTVTSNTRLFADDCIILSRQSKIVSNYRKTWGNWRYGKRYGASYFTPISATSFALHEPDHQSSLSPALRTKP